MMSLPGKSVLLLDDEENVRINLEAFLEDEDFTVLSAATGEEALKILETGKADVGIIDMRLPGIDGNEVIQRAHELQPDMKFIIYTGSTNYSLPATLKKIGLRQQHVFIKPLPDMAVLSKAIHELTG